jgi:hypothetical protein
LKFPDSFPCKSLHHRLFNINQIKIAIIRRSGWKQLNSNEFEFTSGEKLLIENDDNAKPRESAGGKSSIHAGSDGTSDSATGWHSAFYRYLHNHEAVEVINRRG